MNAVTLLAVVLPVLITSAASAFRAYLDYKKAQTGERDLELEAAVELAPKMQIFDTEEFVNLYLSIKFVREHPDALKGHETVRDAYKAFESEKR